VGVPFRVARQRATLGRPWNVSSQLFSRGPISQAYPLLEPSFSVAAVERAAECLMSADKRWSSLLNAFLFIPSDCLPQWSDAFLVRAVILFVVVHRRFSPSTFSISFFRPSYGPISSLPISTVQNTYKRHSVRVDSLTAGWSSVFSFDVAYLVFIL
jgi:hypothetical protein